MTTSIPILLLSSVSSIKEKKVDQSKSLWKIKLCPLGIPQSVVSLFFLFQPSDFSLRIIKQDKSSDL